MAAVVSAEIGCPISASRLTQADAPFSLLRTCVELAGTYPWEVRRPGVAWGETVVRRVPVGVVVAIVPWNVPQVIMMAKLAPALLAGCCVVVKPSPEAPLDALLLAEALAEADLPPGVVSILPARADVGEHLVRHPHVDKVTFTGSTAIGRKIAAICGERLARVSLELGGKSAALILDDADIARTAAGLRFASFINSGQACAAQTRVVAPRHLYGDVVDALGAVARDLRLGDPADPAVELGPLASERQRERVRGYIELGAKEGARLVAGGAAPPAGHDRGWYVSPTVFADADNGMRIAREEIFGPVVTVIPYDGGDEDGIRIANDSEYGLGGSVWTADRDRGLEVARRIRTGTLGVNYYGPDFNAPFGGFKASGIGREYGPEGFDPFVEAQSIGLLPSRRDRAAAG
jgi:betaine-aldehyde dehydrogenase